MARADQTETEHQHWQQCDLPTNNEQKVKMWHFLCGSHSEKHIFSLRIMIHHIIRADSESAWHHNRTLPDLIRLNTICSRVRPGGRIELPMQADQVKLLLSVHRLIYKYCNVNKGCNDHTAYEGLIQTRPRPMTWASLWAHTEPRTNAHPPTEP